MDLENHSASHNTTDAVRLKRSITLTQGIAVICGSVIGAGIFISPSGVAVKAQSGGLTIILWMSAGLVSLLGALVYAELGLTYPKSGGGYEYLHRMYGSYVAFLFSWRVVTFGRPGAMAIKIAIFSNYVIKPFFNGDSPDNAVFLISLLASSLLILMNAVTVRWSARGQTVLSVLSVLSLLVIIGIGFTRTLSGQTDGWNLGFDGSSTSIGDWTVGFFSAGFAYTGCNALNYLMEEMIAPKRNFPRALAVSMVLITLCYTFTNISYLSVLGIETITGSKVVALDFALKTFPILVGIFSVLIALINVSSFNVSALQASRVMFVSGRDNIFPRIFGFVNIRFNTPMVSIFCLGGLVVLYSSLDLFFLLNNIASSYWLFEFIIVAGLVRQRYKYPDLDRPLKLPIALFVCYGGFCFALVLFSAILKPTQTLYGIILIVLTGTPYYLIFVTKIVRIPALFRLSDRVLLIVQKLSYSVHEEN